MNNDTTVNVKIKATDDSRAAIEGARNNFSGLWKQIGGGVVVANAVQSAFNLISGSIGDAVKRVDTLNNSTRAFEDMGFKADDVKKSMKNLDMSIRGLPTSLDQAVSGVQLLAASNGNIGEAQKVYSSLNDAILGFGGSSAMVSGAVTQLSQDIAGGRITAMTWNSMLNNGMGPTLNAIAKQLGVTTDKLKTGLSSGSISVDKFQSTLISLDQKGGGGLKSLHKIALDSTSGIGTGLANARTAVVRGIANIIQAIGSKGISDAISKVGKMFESLTKSVVSLIQAMQRHADLIKLIASILLPIAGAILTVVTAYKIWKAAVDAVKAAQIALTLIMDMNPIILAITAVIAVALLLVTHWNTVKRWFASFMSWFKQNWTLLLPIIFGPFGLAAALIIRNWNTLKTIFSHVGKDIQHAFKDVEAAIEAPFKAAFNAIKSGIKDVTDTFNRAKHDIGAAPGHVTSGISGLFHKLPGFANGGVVPGPVGSPLLAIVHGGERVIPNATSGATNNSYSSSYGGNVTIQFTGPVYMTDKQQGENVGNMLAKKLLAARAGSF